MVARCGAAGRCAAALELQPRNDSCNANAQRELVDRNRACADAIHAIRLLLLQSGCGEGGISGTNGRGAGPAAAAGRAGARAGRRPGRWRRRTGHSAAQGRLRRRMPCRAAGWRLSVQCAVTEPLGALKTAMQTILASLGSLPALRTALRQAAFRCYQRFVANYAFIDSNAERPPCCSDVTPAHCALWAFACVCRTLRPAAVGTKGTRTNRRNRLRRNARREHRINANDNSSLRGKSRLSKALPNYHTIFRMQY
jgi:hypothetical protein